MSYLRHSVLVTGPKPRDSACDDQNDILRAVILLAIAPSVFFAQRATAHALHGDRHRFQMARRSTIRVRSQRLREISSALILEARALRLGQSAVSRRLSAGSPSPAPWRSIMRCRGGRRARQIRAQHKRGPESIVFQLKDDSEWSKAPATF